jgi:hypothetical protein
MENKSGIITDISSRYYNILIYEKKLSNYDVVMKTKCDFLLEVINFF